MSNVSGNIIDANTKQPLAGVVVQAYDAHGNALPGVGDSTDTDGSFYIDDPALDGPGVTLETTYPGYGESVGSVQFYNGDTTELYPSTSTVIPTWVWIVLATAIVLGGIYLYKNNKISSLWHSVVPSR